ncbi:MAG: histidinol-phosphatase (PHP family) [Desulforhopalus sp.]|jgi:histidinol-phosphatase (PHP family)
MGLSPCTSIHCDTHVHTRLCGHAVGEMEDYVQAAVRKGLERIVFLEHMEEGILTPKPSWLSETDFDYYFKEGGRLQEKYGGEIDIGLGVECGYNPDCKEILQKRLSSRKWDQIGISCHFLKVENEQNHLNLFSKNPENINRAVRLDTTILFDRYLDTLLEAVTTLNGTLLCHLDAAFRWIPGHVLTKQHYVKIDAILGQAAAKGMALEINTSGIAIRNEPFPNSRILTLARKHSMTFQLGSDAHKPENVGNYFDQLSSLPFLKLFR